MRPRSGGGRPPKLSQGQKTQLRERLELKDNWLTSEVRALIKREFGITYSMRQMRKILRGFRMHYAKPYPHDYRRPDDAEELLALELAKAVDDSPEDSILGFMDQSSPQTTDNRQRYWSFTKPQKQKNTSKIRANTFGFYPLNGKEVLDFKEHSTYKEVCQFLRLIREKKTLKHIILIWDNARPHIAKKTRDYASKLDITLVYLPAYSPDLNPIEQIWKSIRRRISQTLNKTEHKFKETIRATFHHLAKKPNFAQGWLKKFQPQLSNLF